MKRTPVIELLNLPWLRWGGKGRVVIEIEKKLPVQAGLGGGSANAVSALLGLERAVKKSLPGAERLRIAAEVGSDLPLFLVGGTCLGVGRGEEVYPLRDLPGTACVIATPVVAVSTPRAFADWDSMQLPPRLTPSRSKSRSNKFGALAPELTASKLTEVNPSDRMNVFSRRLAAWLSGGSQSKTGKVLSGVSARGGGRAEKPLLDLVRTGIENDFERVVFPKYPELREVKSVLECAGAIYASLSGSGSAVYGLFASWMAAEKAAGKLRRNDVPAAVTTTLTRPQYWKKIFD